MKKFRLLLSVLTILAFVFVFAPAPSASAQEGTSAPGVWGSSINLQNVGDAPATIAIQFYSSNGTPVYTYNVTEPLAVDGALSLYVPAVIDDLGPGQYSAVVSSDQPVLASVNTASTNSASAPWTGFAYDGFDSSQAGSTLYFPGNYNNYYNFYSELVIQNTSADTPATVSGKFLGSDGSVIQENVSMGTIPPGSSRSYAISSITGLPSGNTSGLFGAVIESTQPIVGVANIWRTTPTAGTASYSGFTGGSAMLFAPALYNNYYGFASALTVQNVGGVQAAGTITYSNGQTANFNLAPGAAQEFYQPANTNLPSGNANGVFAASVEATSGEVVGLVSLSLPAGSNGDFASYNVPASASATVNIPNVNSDYYGYFSAVTVQNTGESATNVTITYADGTDRTFSNIPANGVINILHLNNAGDTLPNRTSSSATVTSSNGNELVAVIQHNTADGVDGYNAAKKPSDFLLAVTGVTK